MAKIQIKPHKGTIEQSKNIIIALEGLNSYNGFRVYLENKTNGSDVIIKNNENNFILIDSDSVEIEADLNIPDDFNGSLVSLFVIIKDNETIKEIFPVSFFIDDGEGEFYGNISLEPSFLSLSDIGRIEITSDPLSKFVFVINDVKFSIFTQEDGSGSFNFRMSDIVNEEVNLIERYPIYFYGYKENYTQKKFTGIYVNLIPENIRTFSYDDPRCDPNSTYYDPNWMNYKIPDYCRVSPGIECEDDEDCPPGHVCVNGKCTFIFQPPNPPTTEIERRDSETIEYSYLNMCRINSASFSMMRNGEVFGGFSSIQKNDEVGSDKFNVNGYGFDFFSTSIVNKIVASGDVSICPNSDKSRSSNHDHHVDDSMSYNFDIYISENIYYQLKNVNFEEIKIVLIDNFFNYVSFKVLEIKYDESNGNYLATLDNENSKFIIHDWIFCVPSIFYRYTENENTAEEDRQNQSLNYLTDEDGNYIKILNISVASNPYYHDNVDVESYDLYGAGKDYFVMHFIVEGLVNNQSQLFYSKQVYDENKKFIDPNFDLYDEFNSSDSSKTYLIPENVDKIKIGFKTYSAPDSLVITNMTTSTELLRLPNTYLSKNGGSDFSLYDIKDVKGDEIRLDVETGTNSTAYVVRLYYHNGESNFTQITFDGNNKNPKSSLDTNGNLHVVWESDRMGKDQVYYGILGEDYVLNSLSALSSSIDKNSKIDNISLFSKDSDYSGYEAENIFGNNFEWDIFSSGSSSFIDTIDNGGYFKDIRIEANPNLDGALAIASMKIVLDEDLNDPSYEENVGDVYAQINYQISFDFSLSVNQKSSLVSHDFIDRVLHKKDIDIIYDNFIKTFTPIVSDNIKDSKIYQKNDKKYFIGRMDGIYDRIVPIFGSYDFCQEDPSIDSDYGIKLLKNNQTLKDYSFGLLLEKVYFKATEIEGSDLEEHTIFTGNAKLVAIIKTEDEEYFSDYFIIKEINDSFNVFDNHSFNLIVNYVHIEKNKYSCILSLMDGDREIFSQSFVSDIDCKYNYFDISFGFPEGRSYVSDNPLSYKMSIYDNVDLNIDYTNINISSPTYFLKDDIIFSPYIYGFRGYRLKSDINAGDNAYKLEDFYFAEDSSEGSQVSEWPESEAAFYYFMGRLYNVGMESFEDFTIGKNMNGEVINFVGAGNATIYGDCTISSSTSFGRFPTHGQKYLSADTNDFYIEFESPQAAFGFFGTDIGDYGGQLTIVFHFVDGSEAEYVVPHTIGSDGSTDGSVMFFGFISENDLKLFTKVSFYNSSDSDLFGFDQMVIASVDQIVKPNIFSQIPITFEGINKCPHIKSGHCNDASIVWQGNKDKYWNIYTTNSLDKLKYFRYNTMITDTKSNSLMPDIALDRGGNRMIVWHDNRDGNFSIYSARSIGDYGCNFDLCKKEKLDIYKDRIVECYLEFEFEPESIGYYNFILKFFSDQNLNNLQYEVYSQDSLDEFYINGFSLSSVGAYEGDEFLGVEIGQGEKVIVTYVPDDRKNIYDKVLYAVMQGIIKE